MGAAVFSTLAKAGTTKSIERIGTTAGRMMSRVPSMVNQQFSFVRVADSSTDRDLFLSPPPFMALRSLISYSCLCHIQSQEMTARANSRGCRWRMQSVEKATRGIRSSTICGKDYNPFKQAFMDFWRPEGDAPALVMNTTDVASGRRRVISPFLFRGDDVLFLPVVGE